MEKDLQRLREHMKAVAGEQAGRAAEANPFAKRVLDAEDRLTALRKKADGFEADGKAKSEAAEAALARLATARVTARLFGTLDRHAQGGPSRRRRRDRVDRGRVRRRGPATAQHGRASPRGSRPAPRRRRLARRLGARRALGLPRGEGARRRRVPLPRRHGAHPGARQAPSRGELRELDPIPLLPRPRQPRDRAVRLPRHRARREAERPSRAGSSARRARRSAARSPGEIVYSVDLPGGVHFVALDNVSQDGLRARAARVARRRSRARARRADDAAHRRRHAQAARAQRRRDARHGQPTAPQAIADSDAALAPDGREAPRRRSSSRATSTSSPELRRRASRPTSPAASARRSRARDPEHAFHHFLQLDVADAGIHVERRALRRPAGDRRRRRGRRRLSAGPRCHPSGLW